MRRQVRESEQINLSHTNLLVVSNVELSTLMTTHVQTFESYRSYFERGIYDREVRHV